ncbi:MAG: hypothetical protein AB9917_24130 [Negativicutes bacterium]
MMKRWIADNIKKLFESIRKNKMKLTLKIFLFIAAIIIAAPQLADLEINFGVENKDNYLYKDSVITVSKKEVVIKANAKPSFYQLAFFGPDWGKDEIAMHNYVSEETQSKLEMQLMSVPDYVKYIGM